MRERKGNLKFLRTEEEGKEVKTKKQENRSIEERKRNKEG